ncbi:MAG: hypothetical protein HOI80_03245 [Alphaproteobacteria bacterium]|jgi:type-F conjugative transfer system secretin TraK|nr:hypothetical protein [Alphaproteobacteria bacterium]MBT5389493.1 hypothetical protein [Alphaproteobacteria bacterium]MBT5540488.1 hypothetical protein [Alphaproteobacteria bacterium]MBT5654500.1 hypothetical protein [Alphaproteobacteria bacterium]
MRKRYLIVFLLEFWGSTASALQTYPLTHNGETKVTLSKSEQNRITTQGDRILHAFGTDGTFDISSEEESGQIFLKLLDEDSPFTLTIITESGSTHDLRIVPKNIGSQSILFTPPKQELSPFEILKSLMREKHVEGFKKSDLHTERKSSRSVSLTLTAQYENDLYFARIFDLQNISKRYVSINPSNLSQKGDIALSLAKNRLRPLETTSLYILSHKYSLRRNSPSKDSPRRTS